jgi:hypothetical protein|tara:strand:+ start:257 stop:478 length:222 start_codon:yes stop_codon:yes gene_type:complete
MMTKIANDDESRTVDEWKGSFEKNRSPEDTAELAAKFMFAMSYYYERTKLHMMLHPVFYVAGFLTAYFLIGDR